MAMWVYQRVFVAVLGVKRPFPHSICASECVSQVFMCFCEETISYGPALFFKQIQNRYSICFFQEWRQLVLKSGKQNQALHSGKLTRQAGKSSIFMREIHFWLKENFIVRVGSHLLDRFFQGDDLHLGFPLCHFCHLFSLVRKCLAGFFLGGVQWIFFCFWAFVFFLGIQWIFCFWTKFWSLLRQSLVWAMARKQMRTDHQVGKMMHKHTYNVYIYMCVCVCVGV